MSYGIGEKSEKEERRFAQKSGQVTVTHEYSHNKKPCC